MKKGKERTGQLVARYGLLVALGLGSTSFVSATAPAPAWDPQWKSVKYVNPGKAAGSGKDDGQAFEYQYIGGSGSVPSQKLSQKAISEWFTKADTSDVAKGLVDKAINQFVAANGTGDLKKNVFEKIADEAGEGDIKTQATALKDEANFTGKEKNISDFFALIQQGDNAGWKTLASDGLFLYLKKDDWLTEPATGVFSLKDVANECAIFEDVDHGSKLDFSKEGIPTVKFMDKDAPMLVEHIAFDKGADLSKCFVKDAPIASDNDALKAVREDPKLTESLQKMTADVQRVAAIMYADEILGKTDPVSNGRINGAIDRVFENLTAESNKADPEEGVTEAKFKIDGCTPLTRNDVGATLTVFGNLVAKSKELAGEKKYFTEYGKVEEILKAAQDDNWKTSFSEFVNSGLSIGNEGDELHDLTQCTNFANAIAQQANSTAIEGHVKCLAKLIQDQLKDVPNEPTEVDAQGNYKSGGFVHEDSEDGTYTSIYQLLNCTDEGQQALVKKIEACENVLKSVDPLDTYSAQKLTGDIEAVSQALLGGQKGGLLDYMGIAQDQKPAAYLTTESNTKLSALTTEIAKQRENASGLFAVTLPNEIAGKSFTVVNRHVFADGNVTDGDNAELLTKEGEVDLSADKIVDLSNDYHSGELTSTGETTKGSGITILTPKHENASVVRVLEAVSGNVDDKGVRHAYSKNVKLGDIITGETGDKGSTMVVLVNHLAGNQAADSIQDKDQRFIVVSGAIKESAAKSEDWATKDNKIDLVISADTLKNVTRFDKPVNVRTITLGTKAGQVFQDSANGTIAYSSSDEGAGQVWFHDNVRGDQMIAQSGKSSVGLDQNVRKFYVREVLADGKGVGLQLALGDGYRLNPTSDKAHVLGAKNGATFAEKCEEVELETPRVDGDKARTYTYTLEGDRSTLALNSMQIGMKAIEDGITELNGIKIADSTPDKLPGVIEVKPGGEDAVCTLNLEAYVNPKDNKASTPTQITPESNKGLNILRVDGPGKLQILGDKGADLDVSTFAFADGKDANGNEYPKGAGLEKGNGFGYAIYAADATVSLVSGQLPVKGNTLIKTLDIAKDAVWGHVAGSLELPNLKVAKGGTVFSKSGDVTVGNVVDGSGALKLSSGTVSFEKDLTLNDNDSWILGDMDVTFKGNMAATKSKATFQNSEGKKVNFKGDVSLSDGSDWRFKGGEIDFTGKTALKNSQIVLDGAKTTFAGDFEVADQSVVDLSNGSFAANGNLALNDNKEWTLKNVDATFEKAVAATKSKALFENTEGKKVDFKGNFSLSDESDWQFKGGEVAFAGKPILRNSKIAFDDSKTTVAGDLEIGEQDNISISGGSFTVQGNLSLMKSETFSGDITVRDFAIKNGKTFTKTGGDFVIGGNAHVAGQIDASQNAQGKIKFTGNDYVVTFEPTPISEDGKTIQTTMVRVAAKDSIEGLDKAKAFIFSDLDYVEEFGTDQLLEVYKNNPKLVLFDNVPDDQSDGILAKINVDQYSIIPGLLAEKGSSVVNTQNASDPDDLRILSKFKGEEYVKGLPSVLLSSLAQPYRVGRRNAGSLPEFVLNEDGSGVTVKGTVNGKGLLDGALAGYAEADVSHAGKRLEAITRSTAEENARAAIQIANSARATAYNNLDKLMDPAAHYSIWASGFGDIARQKVSGYKVNYDIYGFEAGLDAALNNYWTLGILGGYGKATGKFKGEYKVAKIDSYLDKCDTKSYFGGVYGMWSDFVQDLEVKFSLLAGHLKFDEKRNIKSPLTGKSVTDFGSKGWWISGNVDATYKHWDVIGIKLGPWAAFSITDVHQKESVNPIFGKDEVKINDGKGLISRVSEKYNRYAPELTIGVAADYDSPFGLINLAAGYKRDFHKLSGGASYLHSQVLGADGKALDGSHKLDLGKETHQAGKNSFVAQASYNMEYGPVGLSLGVRGQIGDHFKDVAGSATISYSF